MLNSRVLAVSLSLVFLLGCARLDPYQGRESTTPPPVEEGIWVEIEKVQKADWQVPLNVGEEALEWRLRAIDSATSSIDLQSFICSASCENTLLLCMICSIGFFSFELDWPVKIAFDTQAISALFLSFASSLNLE